MEEGRPMRRVSKELKPKPEITRDPKFVNPGICLMAFDTSERR
jgi:hypothetical protein